MKKLVMLLILVLAFGFVLAGCGSKTNDKTASDTDTKTPAAAETEDTTDTEPAAESEPKADGNEVLQGIVDEARGSIDAMKEAFGGTMDIGIEARGNSLVYTYTYLIDVGGADAVKPAIEEATTAQDATFEGLLGLLKGSNVPSPSVIIEYFTQDGELIYSKEYK